MFRLRHKKSAWLLQVFPSKIVPTPFGAAYTDRDIPPLLWKTNDFPPFFITKLDMNFDYLFRSSYMPV